MLACVCSSVVIFPHSLMVESLIWLNKGDVGSTPAVGSKRRIKMERYKGRIAVTVEELTCDYDGEAVMSMATYGNIVKRKQVVLLQRGCRCTPALIDYHSLPLRFRERYERKYGDPEEQLHSQGSAVVMSDEAREFFVDVVLPSGKRLSGEQIEEYTLNASVLDALREQLMTQKSMRKRLNNSTPVNWEGIHKSAMEMRRILHHTLPANSTRLRTKLNDYMKLGYSCLLSGKLGNSNKVKISAEGGRLLVALRRCRVPVHSYESMLEEYNRQAEIKGWQPLQSANTIKTYLNRPEIEPKWYAAVYGELAAKQRFDRKHLTALPKMRDALWYGDATKLNIYYRAVDKNGRMVKKTTMVYEVIDAYSEMFLGFCISNTENAEMQRKAFRMAVETAGHRPFEIVTDNQGGQKTEESKAFMARLCRVKRITQPYTPQAKSIEQIFGRFQSQVLKSDWAYTGANITAKSKESRPNLEFIMENVDELPTYAELCAIYAEYRQQWNDMPHPETGISRREMYMTSVNEQATALSEYEMVDMFWSETTAEFTCNGIQIQHDNRKYRYEVFTEDGKVDFDFRNNNTGRQFIVKYDPEDMTRVWLYVETAVGLRRVCEAKPYMQIHRAIQEQTFSDQEFIRSMTEANKTARLRRQMEGYEVELEYGVAPEQLGLRTPRLMGLKKPDQERIADKMLTEALAIDKWKEDDEATTIGEQNKIVSNMTFDQISFYNKL